MNDLANGNGISKHDKLMFWGCFIALITTAFAFISRMFLIGTWGVQFELDGQQQGALLGAGVWPFAISIVLFSLFIDKIGYKIAMIFSFAAYLIWSVIGVAAFFVESNDTAYQMLYWGSILLGLANGTVEAYINPVVATMFQKEKTKWLNILHAGWPGGLVVAGLITIGLGEVDWWIKIGIIAVPAIVFFVMLIPLHFPDNERVAAGVTYRQMLAEFGVGGALVVAFLLVLQLIEALPMVPAAVFIALGVAMVVGFGVYTMSIGNPFVLVMMLIMIPLATTEIGTDGWITGIMEGVFENLHPGWILVYTSAIMCFLRFCAGPIVHALSPIGLLIASAVLAIAGLMTLSMTAGVMIFAAATLYAFGKTFFWPTMLGVVSEQSPKGGALTLNALGGIGMLAVGVLGFPFIGVLQSEKAITAIENDTAIVETVPALVDGDGNLVATEDKEAYYGVLPYSAIDNAKVAELLEPLDDEKAAEVNEQIAKTTGASAQGALFDMAIFPGIMLVAYIIMFFYFKSKGGYAAQHLTTDEGLSPAAEEAAASAAQE
ncbi:MAG: MFS transporter [Phycisphaeraceae bacterium]